MGGTKPVKTELSRDASIPLHNEPGTSYIPHISQRYNRHQGTGLWELELYGAVLQCHHCDTRQGVYIIFCTVINSSVHCNITGMHLYLTLYKQVRPVHLNVLKYIFNAFKINTLPPPPSDFLFFRSPETAYWSMNAEI